VFRKYGSLNNIYVLSLYTASWRGHDVVMMYYDRNMLLHWFILNYYWFKLCILVSWWECDKISLHFSMTQSWFERDHLMLSWCITILSRFQPDDGWRKYFKSCLNHDNTLICHAVNTTVVANQWLKHVLITSRQHDKFL